MRTGANPAPVRAFLFVFLFGASALMALALPARAAEPDFTTSTATYAPEPAVAGSVVRYDIAIANSGGDSRYTRIVVALPPGYFIASGGDCAATPGDDGRFVLYEGPFPAGARKRCQVSLLPRPDAAGSIATLAAEITTPPAGYFRLEARPTLAGPPLHPDTVFVGPIGITPAGLVTLALLAVAVAGALVLARTTRGEGLGRRMSVGAWIAIVASIGFLVYFASLAREDWRSYRDYQEISCVIVDSSIRAFKGSGKSQSSTYAPEFVVRYDAGGTETYSVATPPSTQLSVGWIGSSQKAIERLAIGSTVPCWLDPADVKAVMLERGPGGAYFFALLPLLVLAVAGWMLRGALRAQ